jgi:ADP-heptose:LPS heptosyltransferase
MPDQIKKYAGVARFGGQGDNLIAASVARPLKTLGYHVEYLTSKLASCVFENNTFIDRVVIKDQLPGDNQQWQDWFMDRSREYDKFGHLSHTCEHTLAAFPGDTLFQWPASVRRRLCGKNYLEFVHDVLEVPYEFGPLFFPTTKEKERAAKTKKQIGDFVVGWCLAGTRIDKVWPNTPIAIARILKEIGPVILFGGNAKDLAMARQIQDYVENQNKSVVGLHSAISPETSIKEEVLKVHLRSGHDPFWSIRRGMSQALACDAYVGPDTGFTWATAFEPMPKVIMLSHASPENITKHFVNTLTLHADQKVVDCWPCHQLHNDPKTCRPNKENSGAACISDISVELLIEGLKTMITIGYPDDLPALQRRWPNQVILPNVSSTPTGQNGLSATTLPLPEVQPTL